MTAFLQQIARHYFDAAEGLARKVFVVPSRRAEVFLMKYFAQEVKSSPSRRPVIAPRIISMDDFFSSLSKLHPADRITLLQILYENYVKVSREAGLQEVESLDEFVFWGDIILGDFGDVDKYMVEAGDLFRNVAQYKQLQDDYSDLEGDQAAAMREFMGKVGKEGEIRENFARTWDLLAPLYKAFNEDLNARGMAYEGSMYRALVRLVDERGAAAIVEEAFPGTDRIVFCGLNALNECERRVLSRLKDLNLAEFCWDWCSPWIKDPGNGSGFFLRNNVEAFPPAFELEKCGDTPEFEVIEVPSAVGQAKVLTDLLGREDISPDERTAIMLPDENMLLPVLGSIPDRVREINVTMGYPVKSSSFYTLMDTICRMQTGARVAADGKVSFYNRHVRAILSNNIFSALSPAAARVAEEVRKNANYYVEQGVLAGDNLLECVFRPAFSDIPTLKEYLLEVLDSIGGIIARDDDEKGENALCRRFALELDFAMQYVKNINLLADKNLDIKPETWLKLLDSLIVSGKVPFKGEPLKGLQIMGPLEFRALDFDNLIILSANEDVFPRHSVASSFIPHNLRRGFGLPTYVYQDAVWAYYFYRMIQRPKKVWMLLDTRTEGLVRGEESRYIKQLQYGYGAKMTFRKAGAEISDSASEEDIVKTDEMMKVISTLLFSASSLKDYVTCPARFYYSRVANLKGDDEVAETMDAGMTGTAFHEVMEEIYRPMEGRKVDAEYIEHFLKDGKLLDSMVGAHVLAQLKTDVVKGRDLVTCRIIGKYVRAALNADLAAVKAGGPFTILGVERKLRAEFGKFKVYGKADRIDRQNPSTVRIVDYKTGRVLDEDRDINESNAQERADAFFNPEADKRPEIAFQFAIYDELARNDQNFASSCLRNAESLENCVYSLRELLCKGPENTPECVKFTSLVREKAIAVMEEIADPSHPFTRSRKEKACEYCDFKTICCK